MHRVKLTFQIICIIIFGTHCRSSLAQTSVLAGFGNLEYLHAGIRLPMSGRFTFESSLGIKPWQFKKSNIATFNNGILFALTETRGARIDKNIYLCAKTFLWNYNNNYNHFLNLAVGPEFKMDLVSNSKKSGISFSAGIAFNNVLIYQRKTYDAVGWPNDWQPSFSITWFRKMHVL